MDAENFFRLSYVQLSELFLTWISMYHTCTFVHMTTKCPILPFMGHMGWACRMEGPSIQVLHQVAPGSRSIEYTLYTSLAVLASSKSGVFKLGVILPPRRYWQ